MVNTLCSRSVKIVGPTIVELLDNAIVDQSLTVSLGPVGAALVEHHKKITGVAAYENMMKTRGEKFFKEFRHQISYMVRKAKSITKDQNSSPISRRILSGVLKKSSNWGLSKLNKREVGLFTSTENIFTAEQVVVVDPSSEISVIENPTSTPMNLSLLFP